MERRALAPIEQRRASQRRPCARMQVATYPRQQSVAVQFEPSGKLSTRDLIEALSESDIKAANLW